MATKRMVAREKQLLQKHGHNTKRAELKTIMKSSKTTSQEKFNAMLDLQKKTRCKCMSTNNPLRIMWTFTQCLSLL